jgi:hypothetical protein
MHDLFDGVNTGIGTTGTYHSRRRVGDDAQSCLHCILHRTATGLGLPAAEWCAVIFDT